MLWVLYALLTVIAVIFTWKVYAAIRRSQTKEEHLLPEDLPTISVCIPARNETHAMTRCLESVIASDYPKMEIIVLDDESSDNTSILIKAFAHAGVRFVEGAPLPEGWLGKNHALQKLLEEASGEYILYMDVDTQLSTQAISRLVAYTEQERATMVSVIPRLQDHWRVANILVSLRYFREIIMHHIKRPAASSSAWLVKRSWLKNVAGGFEQYKDAIQPESCVASLLDSEGLYRSLISSRDLGISYEKRWSSFVETDVRLLYPLLGNNPFMAIAALLYLCVLLSPIVALIAGVWTGWTVVQAAALWQLSVFVSIYALYMSYVWSKGWWLSAIMWPILLIQEIILLIVSVYRYATQQVTWKGRPVVSRPGRSATLQQHTIDSE